MFCFGVGRHAAAAGLQTLLARWYSSAAPTTRANLHSLTLLEAAAALRDGSATPAALVDAAAQRMAALTSLNAFVSDSLEQARAAAATLPRLSGDAHPLAGVPVAVKDNFCVQGEPASAASAMLGGHVPPYSASLVARLDGAGALRVGRTNMDEFGMGSANCHSHAGPALNPWAGTDEQSARVAGGSSGGSAAAVAAGIAYAALGSDTGGSVRLPAAYCGVVGYKPSYGLLSRHGLIAYCSSLDCPGVLARSVPDAALVAGALQGRDAQRDGTSLEGLPGLQGLADAAAQGGEPGVQRALQACVDGAVGRSGGSGERGAPLRGLVVGVPREYDVAELSPDSRAAWLAALAAMQRAGAALRPVRMRHTRAAVGAYYAIAAAEASSNLARYDGVRYGHAAAERGDGDSLRGLVKRSRTEGFGLEVQQRLLAGTFCLSSGHVAEYYNRALQVRRLVTADFGAAWREAGVHVLLAPCTATPAPRLSDVRRLSPAAAYATDVLTVPASLAGLPAVSLPVGLSADAGLPLGLQLIGRRLHDDALLGVAAALEALVAQGATAGGAVLRWPGAAAPPLQ